MKKTMEKTAEKGLIVGWTGKDIERPTRRASSLRYFSATLKSGTFVSGYFRNIDEAHEDWGLK